MRYQEFSETRASFEGKNAGRVRRIVTRYTNISQHVFDRILLTHNYLTCGETWPTLPSEQAFNRQMFHADKAVCILIPLKNTIFTWNKLHTLPYLSFALRFSSSHWVLSGIKAILGVPTCRHLNGSRKAIALPQTNGKISCFHMKRWNGCWRCEHWKYRQVLGKLLFFFGTKSGVFQPLPTMPPNQKTSAICCHPRLSQSTRLFKEGGRKKK